MEEKRGGVGQAIDAIEYAAVPGQQAATIFAADDTLER